MTHTEIPPPRRVMTEAAANQCIDHDEDAVPAYHRTDAGRKRLADTLIDIENRAKRRDRRGRGCYAPRRVHDLTRFFGFTYGNVLPDHDDGRECFFVLACEVTGLNGTPERNVRNYAAAWAPWLEDDELDALVRRVLTRPYRWRAETLGRKLGLLDEVRTRLGIRTIGAIDMSRKQRKRRWRDKANGKRRKMTRAQYLEASLTRSKPWKAEGISRATWYRRRETSAGETSPRAYNASIRRSHACLTPPKPLQPIISPHHSPAARALLIRVLRHLAPTEEESYVPPCRDMDAYRGSTH